MTETLKAQHLAGEALALLNRKADRGELISRIVLLVRGALEFEAVGLRLNDHDDYPFFVSRGFADDFVRQENFLCTRDASGSVLRDSEGNVILECMCKRIRDEEGYRRDLEDFIHNRSGAEFTHGLCPVCFKTTMGRLD
jgi:hypothetical protein